MPPDSLHWHAMHACVLCTQSEFHFQQNYIASSYLLVQIQYGSLHQICLTKPLSTATPMFVDSQFLPPLQNCTICQCQELYISYSPLQIAYHYTSDIPCKS